MTTPTFAELRPHRLCIEPGGKEITPTVAQGETLRLFIENVRAVLNSNKHTTKRTCCSSANVALELGGKENL